MARRNLYRLCDQTVTVYHRGEDGTVTRTVHRRAFLDSRKARNVDRTGSHDASGFLLVIPGASVPVEVGDKVIHGEGPDVRGDEQWREFIPAKVAGLAVVRYVDPKYRRGRLTHTEAGG